MRKNKKNNKICWIKYKKTGKSKKKIYKIN